MVQRNKVLMTSLVILLCLQWSRGDEKIEDEENVKDHTPDESSEIRNLTYSSFSKIKIGHPSKDIDKIKTFLFKNARFLRPYQDWSLRINTEITPVSDFVTTPAYKDQLLSLTAQNELPEYMSTPPTVESPSESQQDKTTLPVRKEKNKAGARVEHFYNNNPFKKTTTIQPETKDSGKSSDPKNHISSPIVSDNNVPKEHQNTEKNYNNEFEIYSDDLQQKATSSKQHTNSPQRYFPISREIEPATRSFHRFNEPSEENLTRELHQTQKNDHSEFKIFSDDHQPKYSSSKQRTNSPQRYFPISTENESATRSSHRFNEPSVENRTRKIHHSQRNVETLESIESNGFKEPSEYFIPLNFKLTPPTTVVTNYQGDKSEINIENSKTSTLEPKRTRPNSQNSQIYLVQSHIGIDQQNKNLKVTPTITEEALSEHTNFGIKIPDNSSRFILSTGVDGSAIPPDTNVENDPVRTNFRNGNKSRFITAAKPQQIYEYTRPPSIQSDISSYFRRDKEAIPHVQASPLFYEQNKFPAPALLTPADESAVESQHDKIIPSEQDKGIEAVRVDNLQTNNHFTENFKPKFETTFPITPRKPLYIRPVTINRDEQFSKTLNKPVEYEYPGFKIHSSGNQYQNPSSNQKILPAEQSDLVKGHFIDTEYSPGSFTKLETSEKNLNHYRNQPQKPSGTLKNVQSKDFSVPSEYFIPLDVALKPPNALNPQHFSTKTDPSFRKSKDSTHKIINAKVNPQQQQPYLDHPSNPSKRQYKIVTLRFKSSPRTPKEQNIYNFRNFEPIVDGPSITHNINAQNFQSVTTSPNEYNIDRPEAIIKEIKTHGLQPYPSAYSRNEYKSTPRVKAAPLLHAYVIQQDGYSAPVHTPPAVKSAAVSRGGEKSHSGHRRNNEDNVRIDKFRYANPFVDTTEAESQAKVPLTSGQPQFDIPLVETPVIHGPKKSKKPRKFEYSEFTSYSSDHRHPTPSNKQKILSSEQVPLRSDQNVYQKPFVDYSTRFSKPSEGHSLPDSYEQQKGIGSYERVKENGFSIPSEYLLPLDIPLIPSSISHPSIPKKETQSSEKNSETIQTIKSKTSPQHHQSYLPHSPNHSSKQYKRIAQQHTNPPPSQIQYNNFDFRIPDISRKFYADTAVNRPPITHNPVLESSPVSQRKFNSPFVNEDRPEKIQNPGRNYRPQATRPSFSIPNTSSVLKNEHRAAPSVEAPPTFSEYDDPGKRVAELRKEFEQIEQTVPSDYQDPIRIQHHHSHTLPTVRYTGYKSHADSDTRLKNEEINYPEKESIRDQPVQASYLQNYPVDLNYRPTNPPATRNLNYENPSTPIFDLQPKNSHSATSSSSHNSRFPETKGVFRTQPQPNYHDSRHKAVSSSQIKPKPITPQAKTDSDKGCKTIVKEIHEVPKGSKPEKLDSQPTSIIKTRICFFPEDSSDEPTQLADVQREFYEPVKFPFDDFREEKLTERNPRDDAIPYQSTNDRDTYKTHSRFAPRSVEKDKDNKHDHHLQKFGSNEDGTSSYVDEFPYFSSRFKEDINSRSHERIPVQQAGEQTAASNNHEERPLSYHGRRLGNRSRRPYSGSRYITDDAIAVKSPYSTRNRKNTAREPYRSGYSSENDESRHTKKPKNYNKTFSFYKKNNKDNNPNSYSEEYVRGRFRTYSSDDDNKKARS